MFFISFLLPGSEKKTRQKIPVKFARLLTAFNKVSILSPLGEWYVGFSNKTNTYFTKGWPEFLVAHEIQQGYSMVFSHKGRSIFSVEIYDNTSCLKEYNGIALGKRNAHREGCHDVSHDGSKRTKSQTRGDTHRCTTEEQVIYVQPLRVLKPGEEEDENEDYESDDSLSGSKFKKKGASSLCPPHTSSSSKKMKGQYVSGRCAITDWEKMKAFDAAFSFMSKNPYCIRRMTAKLVDHQSSMKFPVRFSTDHLPDKKTKVVLKNSAGKEWIGLYDVDCKFSRGLISHGWTRFVRDNHLEKDDHCVFELVNNSTPEFLVHIFRVVEEVVPGDGNKNK